MERFLPNFQRPCLCIWEPVAGRGQLPAKEHSPSTRRGAPGLHPPPVRGAASSQCLRGLQGNVTGLKSVLLLWSGRAGAPSSPAALGQICSGHRSPRGDGAGTALLHLGPCCFGRTPNDAFSASSDAGFGRTGFPARAGKPPDQSLTGPVGAVPWLLSSRLLAVLAAIKGHCQLKAKGFLQREHLQCLCGAL